jgi:hypothetical protein
MKKNIPHILRSGGVGFPKVSSGLLLPCLNAGSEMLWTKFGFLILNSRFLIVLLVGIYAFVGVAVAADTVNYDTAWTFVYDGGKYKSSNISYDISDYYSDVKVLPDGGQVCVGTTRDSVGFSKVLLMKLTSDGKVIWKKLFVGGGGNSIVIAKNGDFIVGGRRVG